MGRNRGCESIREGVRYILHHKGGISLVSTFVGRMADLHKKYDGVEKYENLKDYSGVQAVTDSYNFSIIQI